jgi:hypothetical protein
MQPVWEASRRDGSRVAGRLPAGAFVRGTVAAFVLAMCGGGLAAGSVWAQGESCANEQLRAEQSFASGLGDCRAYEMVSPLAKDDNGVDGLDGRAAAGGEAIMYFSQGSFAEPRSALLNVPYISRRGVAGWVTQSISPPYTEYQGHALYSEFGESLFTDDLSHGVVEGFETPLVSGQPAGYVNLYVADIETGSYEPVTTDMPPEAEYRPFGKTNRDGDTLPEAVGASSDLSHVVFQFKASLCCGASPLHTHVYEEAGGVLRQVDVPPEGGKLEGEDNAGAAASFSWPASTGNPWRAVSANGSRVVFTGGEKDAGSSAPLAGQVYVRENPLSGVDGCSAAGGACTVEVSASEKTNGSGPGGTDPNAGKGPMEGTAWYRGASVDGSRVFFTSRVELTNDADTGLEDSAANLYEYDFERPEGKRLSDLTPENVDGAAVLGVVTASEDGSYVYFVAEGVLTNGKNGEGREPSAGQPNLYLSHGGSVSFIAKLAPRVGGGEFPGLANALGNGYGDEEDWLGEEGGTDYDFGPGQHSVRVTGDGTLLAFTSELGLTGYDNRPAAAGECEGERCREVYLFDAVSGRLVCLSCDVGSRPVGPSALGGHESMGAGDLGEPSSFYVARNISEGGGRVFFQSADALVPQDSNGLLDVYEWERPGAGSCTESVPAFRAGSGGCVFPVSDVAGGSESFFMDASGNGDDVFIATADQLVPSDTDPREDVYDVRVDGGFPVTAAPPVCTNADSCKPPVSPQPGVFGVPASATFSGPGNLVPSNPVPSSSRIVCAKSKRLIRGRCVAKKKRKVKEKRSGKDARRAGHAGRWGVAS